MSNTCASQTDSVWGWRGEESKTSPSRDGICKQSMLVCIVLALLEVEAAESTFQNFHFQTPSYCKGQVLEGVYRNQTLTCRSVVECVTFCGLNLQCLSVVFDRTTHLCHLGTAKATQNCSNMETASKGEIHLELIRSCTSDNESIFNEPCPCNVLSDCQPVSRDCTDGYKKGMVRESGVYAVQPALGSAPFLVYCQLGSDRQVRTFVVRRETGDLDFNRTWPEFQSGFGALSADHWLGLDKLHLLTAGGLSELRFRVKLANGSVYYQFYKGFQVSDLSSGYSLVPGSNSIDKGLGDCLTPLAGAPFSTYDNDNDGDTSSNCAVRHGAGWWFLGANCSSCSPLGPLRTLATGVRLGVEGEAFWTHGLGDVVPFTLYGYLVQS